MQRQTWANTLTYILTVAGATIGFGATWRFPYLVSENGEATFVLVFCVAMILIGISVILVENVIGHKTQSNSVDAFTPNLNDNLILNLSENSVNFDRNLIENLQNSINLNANSPQNSNKNLQSISNKNQIQALKMDCHDFASLNLAMTDGVGENSNENSQNLIHTPRIFQRHKPLQIHTPHPINISKVLAI